MSESVSFKFSAGDKVLDIPTGLTGTVIGQITWYDKSKGAQIAYVNVHGELKYEYIQEERLRLTQSAGGPPLRSV